MSQFTIKNGSLHAESVALSDIAQQFGTPAYVYSRAALEAALQEFLDVLNAHPSGADSLVCYAVKANSNLAILNLFARMGAGFDIVSGGELQRVLAAGADPEKVVSDNGLSGIHPNEYHDFDGVQRIWTIDDEKEAKELMEKNVAGIFTNDFVKMNELRTRCEAERL